MRFISKRGEPGFFSDWKSKANEDWQPSWDNFANPEKSGLKEYLLDEQGGLCCYCCRRVDASTSHIEHIRSRKAFKSEALDYTNMLACCMGETEDPPPAKCHCGCKKGDWFDKALFVSPLDPACESYFAYTAYGEIFDRDGAPDRDAAKATISKLNLDCKKLIRLRSSAIEAALVDFEALSTADLLRLREGFRQPTADGSLTEFYPAIVYVLNGLI